MKETILLTGYAGFIGSQILRDLIKEGYNVIGLDNFSEGSNKDNFNDIKDFFDLEYDISNPNIGKFLEYNSFTKIDYIINCAAQSHVDRSFDQVTKFIDSNIKGPLNLASLALNSKWGVKKFVQVSTDEVFADSPQPFYEGSTHSPQNAYASSKSSAEMFLRNYHRAFDLPLVITNGANTYGKRQFEEKIIPLTIKRIVSGEKVPLYRTPAQRMWLHVEDHSSGIINAMKFGNIGESYCIAPDASNELYTKQLVFDICEILGKNFQDVVDVVEDRPNYDLRYYMSNEKAINCIGWQPFKNIKEELPKIVEYYLHKFKKGDCVVK